MNDQKEYWNNEIRKIKNTKPKYDHWLDKYMSVLSQYKENEIIELGCGWGDDTFFLREKGLKFISCDFSEEALKKIKELYPEVKTMNFDLLDGIPFDDESTSIIIADLCLHYFTWANTVRIVDDIYRVLKRGGYLLCRVNSTKDKNYNTYQGIMLENNYYLQDGCTKRVFDKKSIEDIFVKWEIYNLKEYSADKYHKPKVLWEIAVSK